MRILSKVDDLDAAYLAAIVESSEDGIIGKDLSGVIRSWNAGAQVIFGYSPDEVVGQPVQLLFPPDRLDEEDLIVQRIRRGERVDHLETMRRRKDGSDFPVSVTISPIRNAEGVIVGASKIVRDISERHQAQMELVRARDALEEMVLERTKALEERDLLLREVYHRVKNNLQVVDGMLTLQALKIGDAQARDALMGLRSRIQALGLVHQQLMGSANLRTFDVAPFLRELTRNIVGGSAGERITLFVDASALQVGLDFAIPLGLVVTELVTNSLKHAFPDGVGTVSVLLQPDGLGQVVLIVSDDGPALAPVAAESGLGSGIVKRLVAQLGGEMTVRRDGGTTTQIIVPLTELA
ncbi:MAG: PAS domain S-box protein [Alphaproteobacteria bacterium]|nr:PAS domain S-box protein [Alphaproteobacteria bacterium]MBU1515572.1 PAS domain S-box protein [Alphaproteobacteria bacterium]MBU2095570.1 PAS domain S-box protein [Alphaproteobacteria bacterium]MBU2150811.1 PAS domain S-box protein [Alphaproteobacteria bacterium]MBU2307076.1 PAS domain S-box protein [Alphaproteobacteria bacterium]